MQGAQVRSLVGELRSLHAMAKKKKKKLKERTLLFQYEEQLSGYRNFLDFPELQDKNESY